MPESPLLHALRLNHSQCLQHPLFLDARAIGPRTGLSIFLPRTGGPAQVTRYLYEGVRCIEELDEHGATTARYIYGGGADEVVAMTRGGRQYFFHHQHVGSISHVTDEQGTVVERYEYDEYGRSTILDATGAPVSRSTIGNPVRFTGRLLTQPSLTEESITQLR